MVASVSPATQPIRPNRQALKGGGPQKAIASLINRSWPPENSASTASEVASSGVSHARSIADWLGSQSPSTGTT